PRGAPRRVTGFSKADATQRALAGRSPSADPPAPPPASDAAPLQTGRTFEDRSAEAAPSAPAPPRRSPYLHQGSMNAIRNLRARAAAPEPVSPAGAKAAAFQLGQAARRGNPRRTPPPL
ncbi:MAG: hypothetical protein KDD82_04110, partial [Planctomycetes bacterium]|nr:hypothetical protein [Planctomycetota bacterium]